MRVPFARLPRHVLAAVEGICAGPVTAARDLTGGFSPACAALVTSGDQTFFVKAVGAGVNPDTPGIHRREIGVLAALADSPVGAPSLLGSFDDGDWVALVTEAVPGAMPSLPWQPADLARLMALLEQLHTTSTAGIELQPIVTRAEADFTGWRTLSASSDPDIDDWALRRLGLLAEIEAGWKEAADGRGLLHFDVRRDNLLVTHDDARLVDWAWAGLGNPLFELVTIAPAIALQGGPAPAELLARTTVGRAADPEELRILVATWAGMLTERSLRPPPPGLPTVRAFQRANGTEALRWLKDLLP